MKNNPNELTIENSVLAARKDGYDVYFVSDCSGGVMKEAHEDAKVRMTMAGAQPINWMALTGEWAPYWASQERTLISKIESQRGVTSSSLLIDWITAQIAAGVVSQPAFMR
jgi:Isochorismatase family